MFKKYQYYAVLVTIFALNVSNLLSNVDWWRVG